MTQAEKARFYIIASDGTYDYYYTDRMMLDDAKKVATENAVRIDGRLIKPCIYLGTDLMRVKGRYGWTCCRKDDTVKPYLCWDSKRRRWLIGDDVRDDLITDAEWGEIHGRSVYDYTSLDHIVKDIDKHIPPT